VRWVIDQKARSGGNGVEDLGFLAWERGGAWSASGTGALGLKVGHFQRVVWELPE